MADEDGTRARHAAEIADDTAENAEGAASARPKRFMTPDWEDWDDASSGDTPDNEDDQAAPVRGGRFAAEPDESTPPDPQTPIATRGRFSMDEAVAPMWPDRTSTAQNSDAQAWPTPSPTEEAAPLAQAAPSRARHGWGDESSESAPESTLEQPTVAPEPTPDAPAAAGPDAGAWRPIPVESVPGASRAAQSPTLAEKRRREAPALPTTPQPMSPSERREALAARERSGRSVAPGSLADDDWTGAPLPASAVPPPAAGQAPTPIAVQEGDAPVAHRAYTRPADEPESEDEDTLWLSRKPSSRAVDPTPAPEPEPSGIATPVSASSSRSLVIPPPTPAPVVSTPVTPMAVTPAPVAAPPSIIAPVDLPTADAVQAPATSAWLTTPGTVTQPAAFAQTAPATEVAAEVTAPGMAPAETTPVQTKRSGGRQLWRRRPFQIGAAALILAVALVAGFLVWANRDKPSAAASSQTAAALVEHLVAASDLSGVGPGPWTEQKTESTVTQDSPAPLCFVASPDLPTPTAQAQRKLSATGASMLHRITTYATAAEASQVYAQRLTQLGQCSNIPVYLSSGATISSLGDDAVGVTAVIQDPTAQYHTVILVRTGSMILTYDVAQAGAAVTYERILAVAATTVKAVCSTSGGGCSATPTAITGMPPTSAVPGWLTVSDLPRITTGMGRWNATAPKTTVTSAGSACENLTLATVAGPNQRRQRTYLLTEDTKVPKDFGLDEIVLDFDTPDAAAAFATQLKTSIDACPARTATAKLGNTGDITATGSKGQAVTGFWRTLTQSTNATTTFVFRVGVASVGTRVIYLLATPSTTFDFTDADWATITSRAGQRATQGG
jgi:hypothetical protein